MSERARIETLDDLAQWAAYSEARTEAYWLAQHRWNEKQEQLNHETNQRLTTLEKRVVWAAGFASAIGAVGGVLIKSLWGT